MIISNHFVISGVLSCILFLLYSKFTITEKLYNLLTLLLLLNFLSFNIYLFSTGNFDYKIHLPLHLCYLAELGILISILFKNKKLYPWLVLSSVGGGITGFTNSNLLPDSMLIEYIHLYLGHFNLLLFSIIVYKEKLIISNKRRGLGYALMQGVNLSRGTYILFLDADNIFLQKKIYGLCVCVNC